MPRAAWKQTGGGTLTDGGHIVRIIYEFFFLNG